MNADDHVVVLRPHGVDLGMLDQEVLHHLERVVAAPVAVLAVEHLDVGALDAVHEGVVARFVDRNRQAADDDDVALAAHLVLHVDGGVAADAGIVAADVQIVDRVVVRDAVDDRNEGPLALDLADRVGQHVRDRAAGRPAR
jgi:hypothetical protein